MAQLPTFVSGDHIALPVTLQYTVNGVPQPLDLRGITVHAAIVTTDRKNIISQNIVTLSETAAGADFLNAKVVAEFPSSETVNAKVFGSVDIAIKVAAPIEKTWYVPARLERGVI